MRRAIASRLTYANVMATLAVFVALGGTGYAVSQISGSTLKKRSVPADRIQKDSLGAKEVNEARLRFGCPKGMRRGLRLCVGPVERQADNWYGAVVRCSAKGQRLPTVDELLQGRGIPGGVTPQGEFTTTIFEARSTPGTYTVAVVHAGKQDGISFEPTAVPASKLYPYRCVVEPPVSQ